MPHMVQACTRSCEKRWKSTHVLPFQRFQPLLVWQTDSNRALESPCGPHGNRLWSHWRVHRTPCSKPSPKLKLPMKRKDTMISKDIIKFSVKACSNTRDTRYVSPRQNRHGWNPRRRQRNVDCHDSNLIRILHDNTTTMILYISQEDLSGLRGSALSEQRACMMWWCGFIPDHAYHSKPAPRGFCATDESLASNMQNFLVCPLKWV